MKKAFLLTLGALALSLHHAAADITFTQEILQPDGKKMTSVAKIKGEMMRTDIGPQASAIVNIKTGDMITLMHDQKMAMKIPGSALKALQQQAKEEMGSTETSKPVATGRTETINGFKCEEYTLTHSGAKMTVWLTKDIPDATAVMKQLDSLSSEANPFQGAFKGIEGFPVRTSVEIPGSGPMVMTVLGINRDALPDAEFATPSGYREMAMPVMPTR